MVIGNGARGNLGITISWARILDPWDRTLENAKLDSKKENERSYRLETVLSRYRIYINDIRYPPRATSTNDSSSRKQLRYLHLNWLTWSRIRSLPSYQSYRTSVRYVPNYTPMSSDLHQLEMNQRRIQFGDIPSHARSIAPPYYTLPAVPSPCTNTSSTYLVHHYPEPQYVRKYPCF